MNMEETATALCKNYNTAGFGILPAEQSRLLMQKTTRY